MHGILLFAHGARDPAWATPFHTIAAHMRQESGGRPVALAFLELMTPSLHDAAAELRFEYAARLRDEVNDLRKELKALDAAGI